MDHRTCHRARRRHPTTHRHPLPLIQGDAITTTATDNFEAFLDTWATAERDGDTATTDRLLTDDFDGIGPVGYIPPQRRLAGPHSHGLHYDRWDLDEIDTRRHGDTAIATARCNAHGTAQGHPIPEATRATLIATRDDGDWKLAGIHFSFIAGSPGAPGPSSP